MAWVSVKTKDTIPYTTVEVTYDDRSGADKRFDVDNGICWWINGFWGGMWTAS